MKTLNEFLAENKGITMLGFSWAVYWRMQFMLFCIGMALLIITMAFE